MKKLKTINDHQAIRRMIRKDQSRPFYSITRLVPGVHTLLAIIFVLLGSLTGCNDDADNLNIESKSLLLKNNQALTMPGPPQLLASGLEGASGSTIGPGGALFVTEGAAGRISRIDPRTGDVTSFASGLPPSLIGIGGVYDVAFLGGTAYALVTLVDDPNLFPTGDVNGIYRIDGPDSYTVIADIGAYNVAHPPAGFDFFVSTGVLYSIQTCRGGFLVTDGHLNRVLYVTLDGEITEFRAFGNIVPTGLALSGNTVYMAEAGPTPHLPEDGKVVSFGPNSSTVTTVASGARLLVDVEFNRGRTLFALSQGIWSGQFGGDGSPADPNTGSLLKVNADGTVTEIAGGLDRPTSLEFIQNTAYVITLTGDVWAIENVAGPPFGI
jgi:sugar lactone lactonase YvrE